MGALGRLLPMTTRFLIIQHEDNCRPDNYGDWWSEAGVQVDVVYGPTDPMPQHLAADVDGFVVLGGGMNCQSDADNPWLPKTRALIAEAVEKQVPFLGICLGHQLAAVALGGAVARKPEISIGLTEVGLKPEAFDDILLQVVAPGARQAQYNNDAVTTLPEGAVVLAEAPTDGHIQAIRFAPLAWGVQFHPEIRPSTFDEWTLDKPEEKQPEVPAGTDLAALAAEIRENEAVSAMTSKAIALQFLEIAKARKEQNR